MVRSRRVFNQLTDARECLWSVRERVGWDRERGTNSTAYIKAQFVPLCVRFHLIATRWQEVYAHTHAFSLSHSCCLSAIVGVATWPEVEWDGALSVSSSKSNFTKSAIVMSPAKQLTLPGLLLIPPPLASYTYILLLTLSRSCHIRAPSHAASASNSGKP